MERRFGYARISTAGQSPDLQTDALRRDGCDRIFVDIASGAGGRRPELDRMIELLREDDTVVVWRLDRLGRSMRHLIELMAMFRNMGVGFVSLTESIDTTTPSGVLTFNVFAALAQFERDLARERTRAGLESARIRGRRGGRPRALDGHQVGEVRRLYDSGTLTVNQIADLMHVGRATIYRALDPEYERGAARSTPTGGRGAAV